MHFPPLRTLNEILERYTHHPDLCDVYVEGVTDRGLLGWFFVDAGKPEITVYEIDTVEIPARLVRDLGLENNNRGRVIALARFLHKEFGTSLRVSAVVDADLSYFFDEKEDCPLVLMTDYTSMEMYFFNSKAVHKFISTCCANLPVQAPELIEFLKPILKKLFLGRIANRVLQWNLKSVSAAGSCEVTDNPLDITLDWADYLTRYLSKNDRLKHRSKFEEVVKQYSKKSSLDARRRMHGHDFVSMLALCCSKLRPKAGITVDNLAGMLRSGSATTDLISEPLFLELLRRCPTP